MTRSFSLHGESFEKSWHPSPGRLSSSFIWHSVAPIACLAVQDAGLIFLSRMTTNVAKEVLLRGGTASEAVATALTATAFATASMGVALVVIGKLKLARFVAYLPMPVVRQERERDREREEVLPSNQTEKTDFSYDMICMKIRENRFHMIRMICVLVPVENTRYDVRDDEVKLYHGVSLSCIKSEKDQRTKRVSTVTAVLQQYI